jgi:hypothetical protein
MQIGYMRVSKADGSQSTDLQRDALRAAGVATRRLYEDRASGRLDARPGLDAALKALRRGDTLIVWKLDRLGRDLRHLIKRRPRPQHAQHRFQGAHGPRRVDRHHDVCGQAGVRHLRFARRIRMRPDF